MSKIDDLREEVQRLFGPDGTANKPNAPFICPTPWLNEIHRLLEEEKTGKTSTSAGENPDSSDWEF